MTSSVAAASAAGISGERRGRGDQRRRRADQQADEDQRQASEQRAGTAAAELAALAGRRVPGVDQPRGDRGRAPRPAWRRARRSARSQVSAASGRTRMATSGARPAASLALRTADGGAGAQAISSGASSAESVSQVSVPATWPARKADRRRAERQRQAGVAGRRCAAPGRWPAAGRACAAAPAPGGRCRAAAAAAPS